MSKLADMIEESERKLWPDPFQMVDACNGSMVILKMTLSDGRSVEEWMPSLPEFVVRYTSFSRSSNAAGDVVSMVPGWRIYPFGR